MKNLEIKGSIFQSKIDAFGQALELLQNALRIIESQAPTVKEIENEPLFSNAYSGAEGHCVDTICELSDAIGYLVSKDISELYL